MVDDREMKVRRILLEDWDPLIVGDNPNLSDEYDDLVPSIVRLLENHCSAEQLGRHLRDIEERWKSTPVRQASVVAKRILEVAGDKA